MKISSGKGIHFWTISHDDMGAVLGGVESFSRSGRLSFRGIADEYCTLNHYSFAIIWLILWFKVFWRVLVIEISIPKCVVFIWGITAQNFLKVTSHYWIRPSQLSCLRMNTRFTLIVSVTDNIYWKILRFCSLSHSSWHTVIFIISLEWNFTPTLFISSSHIYYLCDQHKWIYKLHCKFICADHISCRYVGLNVAKIVWTGGRYCYLWGCTAIPRLGI